MELRIGCLWDFSGSGFGVSSEGLGKVHKLCCGISSYLRRFGLLLYFR